MTQARETGADQTGYYGKKANPLKRFMEATLGNPSAVQIRGVKDGKGKFLDNDRVVLRFFGIWDDRSSVYGAKLRFNVHYFLADDTVGSWFLGLWAGVRRDGWFSFSRAVVVVVDIRHRPGLAVSVTVLLLCALLPLQVEVLEIHAPNSGRDKWPALLKRQPLSRSVLITDDRTRGIEDDNGYEDYYTEDDFVVGATINVLGRQVLLYDADE